MARTLEHFRDRHRAPFSVFEFHHLPEPAAELSGPAGIGNVFLAPHDDRRRRLIDLDRRVSNAGRKRRTRKSILIRTGARAAGVERVDHEILPSHLPGDTVTAEQHGKIKA